MASVALQRSTKWAVSAAFSAGLAGLGCVAATGCKTPTRPSAGSLLASSRDVSGVASAPPLRSIDPGLPTTPPHTLERHAQCLKDLCTLNHLVPDEVRPALSDGAPLVLWEQTLGDKTLLGFPRDEGVELAGVVLDGSLDLSPMEEHEAHTVGGSFSGFRAPGGGVTLGSRGGKPARVLLVVAVVDSSHSLDSHIAERDGLVQRAGRRALGAWNWTVRPKRITFFSFADMAPLSFAQGAYHARIGWAAGTATPGRGQPSEVEDHPAVMISILQAAPGVPVPEVPHPTAWESLAFLDGEGTFSQQAGGRTAAIDAKPGVIVTTGPKAQGLWMPTGKAPSVAVVVHAPAGPEQRFRDLAAPAP